MHILGPAAITQDPDEVAKDRAPVPCIQRAERRNFAAPVACY